MSTSIKKAGATLSRMIRKRLPSPRSRILARKYLFGGTFRRIYHYHVRKTAGTSLDAAFWNLVGISLHDFAKRSQIRRNNIIIVRGERRKIEDGYYFYASSHIPAHVLNLPENTFTITLLRDPLDRLLSYYRYLLWARNDPHAHAQEPFLSELQPEIACTHGSFAQFLEQSEKSNILSQLYMFSSDFDIDEACDRILSCSAVGFTEQFDENLQYISERLDLPLKVRHERRFKYETSLSPTDLSRAREMLDPEFKLVEEIKQNVL
jgi:hypothetical protein